jgi:hypothetical protein
MTGVSWLFKFVPFCIAGMNGHISSERNEALSKVLDDQADASAPEADAGDAPTAQAYYGRAATAGMTWLATEAGRVVAWF